MALSRPRAGFDSPEGKTLFDSPNFYLGKLSSLTFRLWYFSLASIKYQGYLMTRYNIVCIVSSLFFFYCCLHITFRLYNLRSIWDGWKYQIFCWFIAIVATVQPTCRYIIFRIIASEIVCRQLLGTHKISSVVIIIRNKFQRISCDSSKMGWNGGQKLKRMFPVA